jgi:hypothetical protein
MSTVESCVWGAQTPCAPDESAFCRQDANFGTPQVRRSATSTGTVEFRGLPVAATHGTVLAHPGGNPARQVTAAAGAFTDPSPFTPHNARVYRFPLTG